MLLASRLHCQPVPNLPILVQPVGAELADH